MKIMICFFFSFLIHFYAVELRECKDCAQKKKDLSLEQIRQLRYAYVQEQILKKLNLSRPPKINSPKPSLKSLRLIAEMTENETGFETEDLPKTESVVIYPKEGEILVM